MVEHLSASLVDCADSGSKLHVGIVRDILRQEINEPTVALQQRKHLHGAIEHLRGWPFNFLQTRDGGHGTCCHLWNRTGGMDALLCDIVGNVSVEQD
jgi:hypothetical protein